MTGWKVNQIEQDFESFVENIMNKEHRKSNKLLDMTEEKI